MNRVLISIAALLLLESVNGFADGKRVPSAVKGLIDLSGVDFSDNAVSLDGEWEFYYGALLAPADFQSNTDRPLSNSGFIAVPGIWNDFATGGGKKAGPDGFATYRLRIKTPDSAGPWAIRVLVISTAYRIWADGALLGEAGRFGNSAWTYSPRYLPAIYAMQFRTNRPIELIVQACNYRERGGGICNTIQFGHERVLRNSAFQSTAISLVILGSLIIMAFYHFGIFMLRRKEKPALYFGLFCLLVCVRLLTTSDDRWTYLLFPDNWEIPVKFEYLTLYFGLPMFLIFFNSLYKQDIHKTVYRVIMSIGVALTALTVFTPSTVYIKMEYIGQIFLVLAALYVMAILILAIARKRDGAVIFIAGVVVLFATVVNDLLYSLNVVQTGFILPFGLFIFILLQSLILSRRLTHAFQQVENLSQDLENKVEQRTVELQLERNRLQVQNLSMLEELAMARKIQEQLIPKQSPSSHIAFFYHPMEQVGGDFFDFISLGEDRMGIFISDVSGHGVPAAFITSMIKTSLLQVAPFINNPAAMLMFLNDSIIRQTAGHFITAFYGIYYPKQREYRFANAGHNTPCIIREDGFEYLSSAKRGIPLAIMDRKELESNGKVYQNDIIVLPEKSKLFLYTDGLLETVNAEAKEKSPDGNTPDFESREMSQAFHQYAGLPSYDLVKKMTERLFHFRGDEVFEDDVCMISMDI